MRPEELRLLANQFRNLAGAAQAQVEFMRGAGLAGSVMYYAEAAELNARTCAEQLEERASHLEAAT